jgi:hypothetical protein
VTDEIIRVFHVRKKKKVLEKNSFERHKQLAIGTFSAQMESASIPLVPLNGRNFTRLYRSPFKSKGAEILAPESLFGQLLNGKEFRV